MYGLLKYDKTNSIVTLFYSLPILIYSYSYYSYIIIFILVFRQYSKDSKSEPNCNGNVKFTHGTLETFI